MIHENSTESYEIHKYTGKLESWRRAVFQIYSGSPTTGFTDRAIVRILHAEHDFNLVRPEITRLIRDGLLAEWGKTKCSVTGRTVRVCMWTGRPYVPKGCHK